MKNSTSASHSAYGGKSSSSSSSTSSSLSSALPQDLLRDITTLNLEIDPVRPVKIDSEQEWMVPKRLKFLKKVGSGAYGSVASFEDQGTHKKVAVKKVGDAFKDLVDAKRILREIKILQHLKHENIISILDIFPPDSPDFEDIYITSELMETDLYRVIYSKQDLTDDHYQYFIYQILVGLLYLHSANVLHRDLKPSNILVNLNCELKICDFGLARGLGINSRPYQPPAEYYERKAAASSSNGMGRRNSLSYSSDWVPRIGSAKGTSLTSNSKRDTTGSRKVCVNNAGNVPSRGEFEDPVLTDYVVTRWYRPPEVILCPQHYDRPVDVWSVGCILAELLGRKALFAGHNHFDQLSRIVGVLGTPTEKDLAWIPSSRMKYGKETMQYLQSLPKTSGKSFKDLFPNATPVCLDLLKKMLTFDPHSRITVEQALKHEYFKGLHMPDEEPRCQRVLDWSFDNIKLTKRTLQNRVFEEIMNFHPIIATHDVAELLSRGIRKECIISATKLLLVNKDGKVLQSNPASTSPAALKTPDPTELSEQNRRKDGSVLVSQQRHSQETLQRGHWPQQFPLAAEPHRQKSTVQQQGHGVYPHFSASEAASDTSGHRREEFATVVSSVKDRSEPPSASSKKASTFDTVTPDRSNSQHSCAQSGSQLPDSERSTVVNRSASTSASTNSKRLVRGTAATPENSSIPIDETSPLSIQNTTCGINSGASTLDSGRKDIAAWVRRQQSTANSAAFQSELIQLLQQQRSNSTMSGRISTCGSVCEEGHPLPTTTEFVGECRPLMPDHSPVQQQPFQQHQQYLTIPGLPNANSSPMSKVLDDASILVRMLAPPGSGQCFNDSRRCTTTTCSTSTGVSASGDLSGRSVGRGCGSCLTNGMVEPPAFSLKTQNCIDSCEISSNDLRGGTAMTNACDYSFVHETDGILCSQCSNSHEADNLICLSTDHPLMTTTTSRGDDGDKIRQLVSSTTISDGDLACTSHNSHETSTDPDNCLLPVELDDSVSSISLGQQQDSCAHHKATSMSRHTMSSCSCGNSSALLFCSPTTGGLMAQQSKMRGIPKSQSTTASSLASSVDSTAAGLIRRGSSSRIVTDIDICDDSPILSQHSTTDSLLDSNGAARSSDKGSKELINTLLVAAATRQQHQLSNCSTNKRRTRSTQLVNSNGSCGWW